METGFILDRGHAQSKNLPLWVEGPPEPSFWGGLKTAERANLEIQTYRCPSCGLLESYAINPAR